MKTTCPGYYQPKAREYANGFLLNAVDPSISLSLAWDLLQIDFLTTEYIPPATYMPITVSRFAGFIFVLALASLLAAPAHSAPAPSSYYGFWEIPEPAGDTAVVIIKRGGRISSFWTGPTTRDFVQGSWVFEDDTLKVAWETGLNEHFQLEGEDSLVRRTFARNGDDPSNPVAEARGHKVDSRVPGSLTVDSSGPRDRPAGTPATSAPTELPLHSTYTGFWQIEQNTGFLGMGGAQSPHFFLHLLRGGSARVALRNWDGSNDQTGTWQVEDDTVLITWPDGRRDRLQPRGESYQFLVFERERHFPDRPAARREAKKIAAADGMRYFDAAEVKLLALSDIRGSWIPISTTDSDQTGITIDSWGQASRQTKSGSPGANAGQWRLVRDRVVIRWNDGSSDVLRLGIRSFVLDHFIPGSSLTGTPAHSTEVRRLEPETLTYSPESR